MQTLQLIKETQQLICNDFELRPIPLEEENALEQIRQWLTSVIEQKMQSNLAELLSSIYRLDIAEQKAIVALTNQSEHPPALALANLIIDREMEKVRTRAWYRQKLEDEGHIDDGEEKW